MSAAQVPAPASKHDGNHGETARMQARGNNAQHGTMPRCRQRMLPHA